jgi:hypothetical protein
VDPSLVNFDLAVSAAGKPQVVTRHVGVELIAADAKNLWSYAQAGNDDGYPIGLAVDGNGQPHVCYTAGGTLRYF